jgi:hypothetical protein
MDDDPLFQSADYDFELFPDGSWKCWADGVVVANGAFSRRDMNALAEDLIRVERSKVGMYANDRYGDQ